MRLFLAVALLAAWASSVIALGQNATITFTSSPELLQLAARNQSAGQILLSANDYFGVLRAAEDLAGDFGKVTGKNLTLGHWESGNVAKSWNGSTTAYYVYQAVTNNVNVSG